MFLKVDFSTSRVQLRSGCYGLGVAELQTNTAEHPPALVRMLISLMSGKTAAGSAGHVFTHLMLTLLLWLFLFCSTFVCCGGIIVVMGMISNLFKVSCGLLTQVETLLCKAQGRQVVRNPPVLMVVIEITQTLVRVLLESQYLAFGQ